MLHQNFILHVIKRIFFSYLVANVLLPLLDVTQTNPFIFSAISYKQLSFLKELCNIRETNRKLYKSYMEKATRYVVRKSENPHLQGFLCSQKLNKDTALQVEWNNNKNLKATIFVMNIYIDSFRPPLKASVLLFNVQKWGKKGMKCLTLTIKYFYLQCPIPSSQAFYIFLSIKEKSLSNH